MAPRIRKLGIRYNLSASRLKHFTLGEITPPPPGSGNWVYAGAGLDALDTAGNGTTNPVTYVA